MLQFELGLQKLIEQSEGKSKKEKDHGGKKKSKKQKKEEAHYEAGIEEQAERVGILELNEMYASEDYLRPKFFSWASSQQEARILIDQAVVIEDKERAEHEFDLDDNNFGASIDQ